MSEGKIKNEFNADDVNFESHDDTAKNDITELSDTVADTALPSSDEKTAEHALEEAEISVSPSVSESTDADETVTDSFRESSEGELPADAEESLSDGEGDGDSENTKDTDELTDNVEARDVEDDGYSEDGETYEDDLDTEFEEEYN